MAVDVPLRFALPLPGGGADFALAQVIGERGEIEVLVENANHLYSVSGRRVLAELAYTDDPITTTSTTYDALPDVRTIKTDRDDIGVITYGQNITVQVELETAAGANIDTVTLTHVGAGTQTATLSGATANTDVVIRVSIKVTSGTGTLYYVRALENQIADADMPTTGAGFRGIDTTAYDPDKPLDVFLLRRTRQNLAQVRSGRGRSIAWSALDCDSSVSPLVPRMCCLRDEATLLLLWHVPTHVTELTLKVGHIVPSSVAGGGGATEVTLRAKWWRLSEFGFGGVPRDTDEADLTGGASSVSYTDLTLDVTDAQDEVVILTVGVESAEGTASEIQDSLGSGPDVLHEFETLHFTLKDGASHTLGSGDQIPTFAVNLRAGASKDSDDAPDASVLRQCIRVVDSGSGDERYQLYVVPAIRERSANGFERHTVGTDSVYRTPLGYLDLYGVTVTETAFTALDDGGGRIDATRPAGRRSLAPEISAQGREWLRTGRCHALSARADRGQTDDIDSSIRLSYTNRTVVTLNSYQKLAEAIVGNGDDFDQAGTSYVRSAYRVLALVSATYPTYDPGDGAAFDLAFQIQCTDLGGGNATSAEYGVQAFPALPTPSRPRYDVRGGQYTSSAIVQGFNQLSLPLANSLRSTPPQLGLRLGTILGGGGAVAAIGGSSGDLSGSGLRLFERVFVDDSQADERLLTLSVKSGVVVADGAITSSGLAAGLDTEGRVRPEQPHVHIVAWAVFDATSEEGYPLGSQIGA